MNRVKKFYENRGLYGIAPEYGQSLRYITIQKRLEESLKLIVKQQPNKILDIGCGDGFFSQRIEVSTGATVTGIDISIEAVEKTKERGIESKQCNLDEGICFDANQFDLAFCGEVIEHVFDPDFLLDEIWRILAPGGFLILSTPNLAAWFNRVLLLFGVQPIFSDTSTKKNYGRVFKILGQGSQPVGHLRLYTLRSIKEILIDHQFSIQSIKALPFIHYPIIYQIDRLIGLFPSLGSSFLILSQKDHYD